MFETRTTTGVYITCSNEKCPLEAVVEQPESEPRDIYSSAFRGSSAQITGRPSHHNLVVSALLDSRPSSCYMLKDNAVHKLCLPYGSIAVPDSSPELRELLNDDVLVIEEPFSCCSCGAERSGWSAWRSSGVVLAKLNCENCHTALVPREILLYHEDKDGELCPGCNLGRVKVLPVAIELFDSGIQY